MFCIHFCFIVLFIEVARKKYEAAIQMLQDMNDRYSYTLAMIGLVKTLLTLNTQKQMVSNWQHGSHTMITNFFIRIKMKDIFVKLTSYKYDAFSLRQ